MSKNSKKFKTVMLKAKYLESELQLAEEDMLEYSPEFNRALDKRINEKKRDPEFALKYSRIELNNDLNNVPEDKDLEVNKDELPKEFKKIYRKIMLLVHPDKLELVEDSPEKERLTELAAIANIAAREEDWYSIVVVATELDIHLGDMPDEYVDKIGESCDKMLSKINRIHGSYAVVWGSANDALKEKLIEQFIKAKFES